MMAIQLNEDAIRAKYAHYMDDPSVVRGLAEMVSDPFLLAFFLMSVSEGEAMGEAGVAAIREEEIAQLIHDIERQQKEEGGHKEISFDLAREFFPEYFDEGEYRYADKLTGRDYYLAVLQQNRERLKDRGVYSRLNLYLTTTFGYEIMVGLYYGAVIDAVAASSLAPELKTPIVEQLRRILDEEDTHLEIATQHNELLAADRTGLAERTTSLLEALGNLTADDYEWAAELSMKEVVKMIGRYASGPRFREEIEASVTGQKA
jgi:hypothetical protein